MNRDQYAKGPGYADTMGVDEVPTNYQLDKRVSILEQTMVHVHEDLKRINAHLSKLVWLLITAIIATILKWVLVGGPPPIP